VKNLGRWGFTLRTIWGLARFSALAAALALAGCVTAENSLSQNDIAGMKLTGVTVSYAPDAVVQWEDGIRAYATAKAITDDQIATATNTPEGKAYVRNMLAPKIKSGIEQKMASQLNGSRPVRLEVVVKSFAIASAVQRILIGGGRGMIADANLVDARTGALIIAYPALTVVLPVPGGLAGVAIQAAIDSASERSPADKIADQYGENYRTWLLRRA
jgi:hypothetical protein